VVFTPAGGSLGDLISSVESGSLIVIVVPLRVLTSVASKGDIAASSRLIADLLDEAAVTGEIILGLP
jgi:hypothetical protein